MKATQINPFNHDLPAADTPLVNVHFNGRWIKVPKGTNVVEVTRTAGDFLPHYCYHPKLSVSGNCRMCLFEMGMPKAGPDRQPILGEDGLPAEIMWMPRPVIGCATQVTEGMGIRTDSPMAQECRKGVMEFLLINHPLDCPICDQAGECKLQEFSSDYGTGESRFVEQKVKKPKNVDLGERIVLDDERCILCSRCVRFAKEVMNDDVLGFVNRGSHNSLTAHPGKRFDNPYSLNTVDICPVGALTSKDFRFKMRVWFLKETPSVCTSCGRGCNIEIGSRQDQIYRLTPRTNEEVNSHWMCDYGRLNFHALQSPERLLQPEARVGSNLFPSDWSAIQGQISRQLSEKGGSRTAFLISASCTNEELYLIKSWAEELGVAHLEVVPRQGEADGFLRVADVHSNTNGARLIGVGRDGAGLPDLVAAVRSGKIEALVCWQEDAIAAGLNEDDLKKLKLLVSASVLPNVTTNHAHFVLPVSGFAEKRGSLINVDGRLQRLNRAVSAPGQARDDWEVIQAIRHACGGGNSLHLIEDVFRQMTEKVPVLSGLTLGKIGDQGLALELQTAQIPQAASI
ncbi:MAG: molybdopterin-dependent oxidoreductase [Candidatus Methylacidiphilales bacterium]